MPRNFSKVSSLLGRSVVLTIGSFYGLAMAAGTVLPNSPEGFVKFESEVDLVDFVNSHEGTTRVHPNLLWAQINGVALELVKTDSFQNQFGIVNGSFTPNQRYVIPARVTPKFEPEFEGLPSKLWGISKINSEKAWTVSKGSPEVVVAIVDTGIDYTHKALASRILINEAEKNGKAGVDDDGNGYIDDVYGYNFFGKKSDPKDDEGHGSHVSGTVAGNLPAENFFGVAPEVKLLAVKTHNSSGEGSEESVVKGILYAVDRGAKVLNCSWGGAPEAGKYSQLLFDAIDYANKKGVTLIAAAGNDGGNNDGAKIENYPSNYNLPNIISVAATVKTDYLAAFSNFGAKNVDVAAPGASIWSVKSGGGYTTLSGTSMAAPHVAGAAALIYSNYLKEAITPEQVKNKLTTNAQILDKLRNKVASGLVDLSFLGVTFE